MNYLFNSLYVLDYWLSNESIIINKIKFLFQWSLRVCGERRYLISNVIYFFLVFLNEVVSLLFFK